MTRPVQASINLLALRYNLERARRAAPKSRIIAVLKANAYGHGLVRVARALNHADAFGVACLEEGVILREANIRQPIVVLGGAYEVAELAPMAALSLDTVVHHVNQIEMLESVHLPRALRVWLKIDTGMHRLGFAPQAMPAVLQRLEACPAVATPVRFLTHFACADDRRDPRTQEQLAVFEAALEGIEGERSAANSAAVLAHPRACYHWIRPGIMLYGVSPFCDGNRSQEDLKPAMTLSTRLIAVNHLKRGDAIGYGGIWACPCDMPVGVAAIGYGDGYPRHAESGTPVLVNGRRTRLVGRVCMDMISVDLRFQPEASVGDPVVLWGEGLPVEEVACHAGTVSYELLCGVSQRVTYHEIESPAALENL
jgi:alanine racemase